MSYEKELKVGLQAVKNAAKLCHKVQERVGTLNSVAKIDRSPVTKADIGSQVVITMELQKGFPDIPILGEEDIEPLKSNSTLLQEVFSLVKTQEKIETPDHLFGILSKGLKDPSDVERFWTVDPIDGTKGFLRRKQYAIALALIEKGEVVLGILGCPNYPLDMKSPDSHVGCLFGATRGDGAIMMTFDNPDIKAICVDNISDPKSARFCESVESAHVSHSIHSQISSLLGITEPPLRIDSQCKYAAVSRGDASIYLRFSSRDDYRENIWDHAAGSIILTEAGGHITDFNGNHLDFSAGRKLERNKGILATNGKIHMSVLDAIAKVIK